MILLSHFPEEDILLDMVHGHVSFDPTKDIPSLAGKVILVTGGTAGLGRQSILELSKHNPSELWLAARNLDRANEVVRDIKNSVPNAQIKLLELDLGSLTSVYNAATQFRQSASRLDILLNNAGIMAHPAGSTTDGYELQFGTNFLGHALLIKLLMPVLLQTANVSTTNDVRIISLTSGSHSRAPSRGIHFETLKTTGEAISTVERYGQSKLANILYAKELASRNPELKVVSVNPGMVNTGLTKVMQQGNFLFRIILTILAPIQGSSIEEGVKNQLWACVGDISSGEYYCPIGVTGKGSDYTKDQLLAQKLWDWVDRELNAFLTHLESH